MKKYTNIFSVHNGYKRVTKNHKWGFIDINDNEICECKYEWVDNFYNGYALVYLNSNYGYIDINGIEVIKCEIYYNIDLDNDADLVFNKLLDDILDKYILNQNRIKKLKTLV